MTPSASISASPSSARSAITIRLISAKIRSAATPREESPLRGDARERRRVCPRRRRRVGLGLEVELARQPRQSQRPQRIGRERLRRHHPQAPQAKVLEAAQRIDEITSAKRLGDRVDGEVALAQIGLDRVSGERQHVDLPGAIAGGHPPRAEALRQLERVRVRRAREPAGERLGVARHGNVEVLGRPAEQPVAHGATDQPAVVRQPRELLERAIHDGSPSRW